MVWNQAQQALPQSAQVSCKLYHKTTWFETSTSAIKNSTSSVANYITKLRGLKLVYTGLLHIRCKLYHKTTWFETSFAQIIKYKIFGCKLYHKTTWFETHTKHQASKTSAQVANYITKLRGLKLSLISEKALNLLSSRKLYHKTTWFETLFPYLRSV